MLWSKVKQITRESLLKCIMYIYLASRLYISGWRDVFGDTWQSQYTARVQYTAIVHSRKRTISIWVDTRGHKCFFLSIKAHKTLQWTYLFTDCPCYIFAQYFPQFSFNTWNKTVAQKLCYQKAKRHLILWLCYSHQNMSLEKLILYKQRYIWLWHCPI